jgi:hypothetical protein
MSRMGHRKSQSTSALSMMLSGPEVSRAGTSSSNGSNGHSNSSAATSSSSSSRLSQSVSRRDTRDESQRDRERAKEKRRSVQAHKGLESVIEVEGRLSLDTTSTSIQDERRVRNDRSCADVRVWMSEVCAVVPRQSNFVMRRWNGEHKRSS